MDFTNLLSVAVFVAYGVIVGLVAPYILGRRETIGNLVPFAVATMTGGLIWIIFTWAGISQEEWWFWLLVMMTMPVTTYFVPRFIDKRRLKLEDAKISEIRTGQIKSSR